MSTIDEILQRLHAAQTQKSQIDEVKEALDERKEEVETQYIDLGTAYQGALDAGREAEEAATSANDAMTVSQGYKVEAAAAAADAQASAIECRNLVDAQAVTFAQNAIYTFGMGTSVIPGNIKYITDNYLDAYYAQMKTQSGRSGEIYGVEVPMWPDVNNTASAALNAPWAEGKMGVFIKKLADNKDLVARFEQMANPSGYTTDDYTNIPMFNWIRCNYEKDEAGNSRITALEGSAAYKTTGSAEVGVMGMTFYVKSIHTVNTEDYNDDVYASVRAKWTNEQGVGGYPVRRIFVTDTIPTAEVDLAKTGTVGGWSPWCESVRSDGSVAPYYVHAPYMLGLASDGKWRSQPGLVPVQNISCDTLIAAFRNTGGRCDKGAGWTPESSPVMLYQILMLLIKHGCKNSQLLATGVSFSKYNENSQTNRYFSFVPDYDDVAFTSKYNKASNVMPISSSLASYVDVGTCVAPFGQPDTGSNIQTPASTVNTARTITNNVGVFTTITGNTINPSAGLNRITSCKIIKKEGPFTAPRSGAQYYEVTLDIPETKYFSPNFMYAFQYTNPGTQAVTKYKYLSKTSTSITMEEMEVYDKDEAFPWSDYADADGSVYANAIIDKINESKLINEYRYYPVIVEYSTSTQNAFIKPDGTKANVVSMSATTKTTAIQWEEQASYTTDDYYPITTAAAAGNVSSQGTYAAVQASKANNEYRYYPKYEEYTAMDRVYLNVSTGVAGCTDIVSGHLDGCPGKADVGTNTYRIQGTEYGQGLFVVMADLIHTSELGPDNKQHSYIRTKPKGNKGVLPTATAYADYTAKYVKATTGSSEYPGYCINNSGVYPSDYLLDFGLGATNIGTEEKPIYVNGVYYPNDAYTNKVASGQTVGWGDYFWNANNANTAYEVLAGGTLSFGGLCGSVYLALIAAVGVADWNFGARP